MRPPSRVRRLLASFLAPLAILLVAGCLAPTSQNSYYQQQRANPSVYSGPAEESNRVAARQQARQPIADAPSPEEVVRPRRPEDAGVLPSEELNAMISQNEWKALLIGISDYSNTGGFAPSLGGVPVNDVLDLGRLLIEHYGFTDVEYLLDQEATRRGILSALTDLHKDCDEHDNILIYYAGHGHLPTHGIGVWIPADAKSPEDGISNPEIKNRLANLPARRVLLVSDSCFSGAILSERALGDAGSELVTDHKESLVISTKLAQNMRASREVITSGNVSPVPNSGVGPYADNSPFAGTLLSALESVPSGAALGTTDLFVETYHNMQQIEESAQERQRPQRGTITGHAGGEFLLIRFD